MVSPAEFWELHPQEVFWLLEARKPPKMYGGMTEAEVKAIYEEDFGPVDED